METNTLAPQHDDDNADRKDLLDFAKQNLDKAMEINHSIAVRQMEVLSMQANETQALLQSGNLTDEQFDKAMQESEKIRQAMFGITTKLHKSNFELVMGACAVLLVGGLFITLRAA